MGLVTYSVWANAPADHPGLQAAAQHLRQIYGGPSFEAHVTVIGAFSLPPHEAKQEMQSLCRSLPPITYRITGVDHGQTYFQCVYLTMDPSPQVNEANLRAQSAFGHKVLGYLPHMSLIYGDLEDHDKQAAKGLIEEKYGNLLARSEFVVNKLCLYETDVDDKSLKTWKLVAEYPLEGAHPNMSSDR